MKRKINGSTTNVPFPSTIESFCPLKEKLNFEKCCQAANIFPAFKGSPTNGLLSELEWWTDVRLEKHFPNEYFMSAHALHLRSELVWSPDGLTCGASASSMIRILFKAKSSLAVSVLRWTQRVKEDFSIRIEIYVHRFALFHMIRNILSLFIRLFLCRLQQ